MKASTSQQRMKNKARAAMEPGLVSKTPNVAVKKSNNMRTANKMAQERPIGLKNGGPVKKLAEGGAAKVRKGVATAKGAPKQQPRNKNPAYR